MLPKSFNINFEHLVNHLDFRIATKKIQRLQQMYSINDNAKLLIYAVINHGTNMGVYTEMMLERF